MQKLLQIEIKKIVDAERPQFIEILESAKRHYSFFQKSFRDRLNQSIQSVLGITIKSEEWVVEIIETILTDEKSQTDDILQSIKLIKTHTEGLTLYC